MLASSAAPATCTPASAGTTPRTSRNTREIDLERWHWHEAADGGKVRIQTNRFENKTSLLRVARKWFEEHARYGDILTEGSIAQLDPQRILFGPNTLKQEGNRLWREFERLGGWDNEAREIDVKAVCEAWDKLFKKGVDT
jgi:hypothetical protein